MKITILNNLSESGIFFLRGQSINGLYLDSRYTQTIVNDSKYDCTGEKTPYYCVGLPNRTFFFHIPAGKKQDLYLKDSDSISSGVVWYSPDGSKTITSGGPEKQAEAEFTISNVVSYDLTFVEAISCGIKMTYTPDGGQPVEVSCVPNKPENLDIDTSLGYPTILSDKYTGTPEHRDMAGCSADMANTVCGQHKCRSYMANLYKDRNSYCGWLSENKCQGYCWAMDEWKCTDERCGYGEHEDWPKDCSVFKNDMGAASNTYSCGKNPQKGLDGTQYWGNNNMGCVDKIVDGKPTNPEPKRKGGTFVLEFVNLKWMSGKPSPSPSPHGGGGAGKNNTLRTVIIIVGVLMTFLAILFGIYWKFLR